MSSRKPAPKKSGANKTGNRNGTSNNLTPDFSARVQKKADDEKLDENVKTLLTEINRNGHSVQSVIELMKAGQTRFGPDRQQEPAGYPTKSLGIVQGDLGSIETQLVVLHERLKRVKECLSNLGYYESLPEKIKDTDTIENNFTIAGKIEVVYKKLLNYNDMASNIIDHLDHLFSPGK